MVTRSCASSGARVNSGRGGVARPRLAPASARHKEAAAVASGDRDASTLVRRAGGRVGATSQSAWWSGAMPIVSSVRGPSRGVFVSARALSGGGDDDVDDDDRLE